MSEGRTEEREEGRQAGGQRPHGNHCIGSMERVQWEKELFTLRYFGNELWRRKLGSEANFLVKKLCRFEKTLPLT